MYKVTKSVLISLAVLASVGLLAYACTPLDGLNTGGLGDGTLIGSQARSDGSVAFAVAGPKTSGTTDGILVEVKNSDGSYSECTFIENKDAEVSEFNTLALLIDDSGSMENEYPADIYPDVNCPTCPHDPTRLRATAASELIQTILANAPDSQLAVMDFGPCGAAADDTVACSEGKTATRVLQDFTGEQEKLLNALSKIDGSEMVGTPLYDSLAENVVDTDETADELEASLALEGRTDKDGNEPEVKRYILVISDGDDRDSVLNNLDDVIHLAQENNVVIHAIGLGPASSAVDPRLLTMGQIETVSNLQAIAEKTGGFYASVNDPTALNDLYSNIALGLTNGYNQETWDCKPDGRDPEPGQQMEGRVTVAGETSEWSVIVPDDTSDDGTGEGEGEGEGEDDKTTD